jgi:hypothetical protein
MYDAIDFKDRVQCLVSTAANHEKAAMTNYAKQLS